MALLWEFIKYALVGGLAFLADWGTLFVFKEYVFFGLGGIGLYLATAMGFIVGVVCSYILSNVFVFTSPDEKGKGKSVKAFIIFVIVGVIGLGLTELGMYLLVDVLDYESILASWDLASWSKYYYMFAKLLVAVIVLVYNYIARKKLIYQHKSKEVA